MKLYNQIKALLQKEFLLEWRQKYAINGLLLYILTTVFIIYISFNQVEDKVWNTLFWILMLFIATNTITKSFLQESKSRMLYYYTLASPRAILLSKIIYNTILMLIFSVVCFIVYAFIIGNPIQNFQLFLIALILGSIGFSLTFTTIALIVAKANNNSTLMAILSFPVIIPMLLMLIKLSKNSLMPDFDVTHTKEILTLLSIDVIMLSVSYILFPYLWRD